MVRIVDGVRPKTAFRTPAGRFPTTTPPAVPAEDLTTLPPGTAPWMTVIVPTRNEAGNIEPLLERLAAGCGEVPLEVLFVDDSTDGTPEEIRALARSSGLAVRLLHRVEAARSGGLSGAVIAGLRQARGAWA